MHEHLIDLVRKRYDSPEELQRYTGRVKLGLLDWEQTVTDQYFRDPGTLLIIGCGCGREAFALHSYGHRITAIDISSGAIAAARGFAADLGTGIDFRITDGATLDFEDGSFDYVLLWSQVLANIPGGGNRADLLRRCHDVLRPGGRISFSVHNRPVCEPIARQQGLIQAIEDAGMEDGDFIETGDSRSETPCFWHYFDRDEINALLAKTGFTVRECETANSFGQKGWDTILVCVADKVGATDKAGAA